MKYNGIVERKLLIIEENIRLIENWDISSFDKFNKDAMLQRAVERALQVAIEAMIDAGERVLSLEKQSPPATSADVIYNLQELGIITKNPAYISMIKFRNFIVHMYEKIDLEIIYNIVKKEIPSFRQFIHEIRST